MASYYAKELSLIHKNPWLRLGAGVVSQAVQDFNGQDLLKAIDALLWFLDEGPVWLDYLNFERDPDKIFILLLEEKCPKGKTYQAN